MIKLFAFCILILSLSACYSTKIKFNDDPGILSEQYDKKFKFSVLGSSPKKVNLNKICPNGVAWIYQEHSFINGSMRILSFGILSASEISVYCNSYLKPDTTNEKKDLLNNEK